MIEAFSAWELVAVMLSVAFAALVHGAIGLGFPLVATPLLALVTDVRTAILLTLLPTIIINIVSIFSDRHWADALRRFWPLPAAAVFGSMLSTRVIVLADPEPFRLLLAAVIVLYLGLDLLRRNGRSGGTLRPTKGLMIVTGLVAGGLAGLVNVLAPVLIVFALETGLAASLLVPVFNLTFLTSKIGQLGTFAVSGAVTPGLAITWLPLIGVAIAFLWIGIRVRRRTDTQVYARWLKIGLWVIAALLIVQYFGF